MAQDIAIITAIVANGLVGGLLFGFAVSVMPGLRNTGDRTYISSFQAMDAAVVSNVFFVVAFVAAPAVALAAVLLHLGDGAPLGWLIAALVLSLATIVITRIVHLPINAQAQNVPAESGDLGPVRHRLETRWAQWNVVRTGTSTAAVVCLAIALAI